MKKLADVPQTLTAEYAQASPYPHAAFDDFFPPEAIEQVLANFPRPDQLKWQTFDNDNERKLAFSQAEALPTPVREFLYFMNSFPVLQFLEKLTGITGLIPDPSFAGGGCHQMQRGGKLGVHVDFNKLKTVNLDRRLNLLVYLNKDWKDEYGGHFELWDSEGKSCLKKILPAFNRCVVFSTTESSYHGLPDPLTCPEGWTRKSVALYYYSNGRNDGHGAKGHNTVFADDKEIDKSELNIKNILKEVTPPVLWNLGRRFRERSRQK